MFIGYIVSPQLFFKTRALIKAKRAAIFGNDSDGRFINAARDVGVYIKNYFDICAQFARKVLQYLSGNCRSVASQSSGIDSNTSVEMSGSRW